jgi:hypothetical protein
VDSIADVAEVALHIGDARAQAPAAAILFDGDRAGPVSGLLVSGILKAPEPERCSSPYLSERM